MDEITAALINREIFKLFYAMAQPLMSNLSIEDQEKADGWIRRVVEFGDDVASVQTYLTFWMYILVGGNIVSPFDQDPKKVRMPDYVASREAETLFEYVESQQPEVPEPEVKSVLSKDRLAYVHHMTSAAVGNRLHMAITNDKSNWAIPSSYPYPEIINGNWDVLSNETMVSIRRIYRTEMENIKKGRDDMCGSPFPFLYDANRRPPIKRLSQQEENIRTAIFRWFFHPVYEPYWDEISDRLRKNAKIQTVRIALFILTGKVFIVVFRSYPSIINVQMDEISTHVRTAEGRFAFILLKNQNSAIIWAQRVIAELRDITLVRRYLTLLAYMIIMGHLVSPFNENPNTAPLPDLPADQSEFEYVQKRIGRKHPRTYAFLSQDETTYLSMQPAPSVGIRMYLASSHQPFVLWSIPEGAEPPVIMDTSGPQLVNDALDYMEKKIELVNEPSEYVDPKIEQQAAPQVQQVRQQAAPQMQQVRQQAAPQMPQMPQARPAPQVLQQPRQQACPSGYAEANIDHQGAAQDLQPCPEVQLPVRPVSPVRHISAPSIPRLAQSCPPSIQIPAVRRAPAARRVPAPSRIPRLLRRPAAARQNQPRDNVRFECIPIRRPYEPFEIPVDDRDLADEMPPPGFFDTSSSSEYPSTDYSSRWSSIQDLQHNVRPPANNNLRGNSSFERMFANEPDVRIADEPAPVWPNESNDESQLAEIEEMFRHEPHFDLRDVQMPNISNSSLDLRRNRSC